MCPLQPDEEAAVVNSMQSQAPESSCQSDEYKRLGLVQNILLQPKQTKQQKQQKPK